MVGTSKPISDRVAYIFKTFYLEKARNRHQTLIRFSELFISNLPFEGKVTARVDLQRITALIDSYFLDIIRFKEYHFRPAANDDEKYVLSEEWMREVHEGKFLSPAKVAAFTAKWMLKYSPIAIFPEDDLAFSRKDRDLLCDAPAMLAFELSIAMMDLSIDCVDDKTIADIVYHFRYRGYDERAFFLIFEQLGSNQMMQMPPVSAVPVTSNKSTRRYDDKSYSVFIAGAEDCDFLREAAREVVELINRPLLSNGTKLVPFDWKEHQTIGDWPKDADARLDEIVKSARKQWGKPNCDILVLSVWQSLGEITTKEYEYFRKTCCDDGIQPTPARPMCCRYSEPPPTMGQIDAQSLIELNVWLDENQSDWIPLGRTPDSITRTRHYSHELRIALEDFLEEEV